jgi:hypothetical protein
LLPSPVQALAHAHVEGYAGPRRGLFEDHGKHFASQRLVRRAGLGRLLSHLRIVEDGPQIVRRDSRKV